MGNLVFLPWAKNDKPIAIGEFILTPYERDKKPFGINTPNQRLADGILEPYRAHANKPIQKALILSFKESDLLKELDEDDFTKIYNFSELFTFSNLSSRKYFDNILDEYCNKDAFQIIIQGFGNETEYKGSAITRRRRDGSSTTYYTKDALFINKPGHIVSQRELKTDFVFLESLLKTQEIFTEKEWSAIFESIISFNLANKDSEEISENIELILINNSFERLLDTNGKEDELAQKLIVILKPEIDLSKDNCDKLRNLEENRFKKSIYIRDIWIRDLFRIRNNIAHGKLTSQYPLVFSLKHHLLLASLIFPIVLKLVISSRELYNLSDNDKMIINVFEKLICAEHFQIENKDEDDMPEFPWHKIFAEALLNKMFE
jgi:hypothetical protein